jgi:hypothetical protein
MVAGGVLLFVAAKHIVSRRRQPDERRRPLVSRVSSIGRGPRNDPLRSTGGAADNNITTTTALGRLRTEQMFFRPDSALAQLRMSAKPAVSGPASRREFN